MGCCSRLLCYKTHDSKQQKPRKQDSSSFSSSSSISSNTQKETMDRSDSPISLSQKGNEYDEVFLSYNRGEYTQKSFSSRLSTSLRNARISVLKDGISIKPSRSIIGACRISIVIFSTHYVSSKKCLEELTKIMEFRKAHDQVLPIFYGMDRCEIHDQESNFQQAFDDLIRRISPTKDKVSRWRRALNGAVGNYGFVVLDFESKSEREVIKNIVKHIRHILDKKGMSATYGLVGLSSQEQEVIKMLQKHPSKDVASVGIWGMAGIGKTTIAKLIFEHIQYDFESTCFLSNVRKAWKKKGKDDLQRQLHSELYNHIYSGLVVDEFVEIERAERALQSKVLIVVDDVNGLEQLHALCGNRYGKGSRIIITTRDKYVLEAFEVNDVYSVKLLSDDVSLELFSRKAFKQASPEGEFIQLSRRVVAYAEGLPLALEVLGSLLAGKPLIAWEETLMKLTNVLLPDLYNTLKLSFDSLDVEEAEIFLNFVLFYIGEDFKDVIQKLDGSRCNPSERIRALMNRSLVTIDKNQKLRIHNLLQLMGRQIIREISQNKIPHQGDRYEVFLSFRGEETRSNFTSHLYSALCNASIVVFKDDVEIPRGNHIKIELLQAIGSSKIAIIIFSKEYAASKWCLEELSTIMELHKSNDQVVLPVFYNVDPSEIRHQTSSFGEAFKDLIHRISTPKDQASKWRTALTEAAGIAGIVVLGSTDESEQVKAIVENVCDILDKKDLFVADHPVGVDDCVQEVTPILQNRQSKNVLMVGIWGMGGIGKTTIAKAIYNEIGQTFESRSYVAKIREAWDKGNQVSLQNQLLDDICKPTKMKINSIESGKNTLRDKLRHKKALVVLDDVDELAQLDVLVGSRDDYWFKPGSVIIITTRNIRLLYKEDCDVYPMKYLNEKESMELLCWHAFKQESPEKDFINLSSDIVAYSGGLPLALEVLGSYLFGREVEEWKSVLEKLKEIPNDKIQKKLKISFDGLDAFEKEIFLDISCFFIGMDRNDVSHILNGCKLYPNIGIKTLVERSLVTIDENNVLGMHDLLRDMGREIIREESQKEIGKRSRLWLHNEALDVLSKHMGTNAIEGLSLKLSQSEKKHFETEAFKMMERLRLLHLENVQLKGDYECISGDLRWLCWHGFPIKYIPSNFYKQKLVAIDLKYSSLRQVWKEFQVLENLKILNLSHSHDLVQTPDFTQLPNLEKLILKDCPSLSMIHDSIKHLDKLLLLDLEDCIGLLSLPRSIYRLKCLETLVLSGCVKIERLEEDIQQMESLTTLIAPTIKQIPYSIVRLKSILYLSVGGHEGSSRHVIDSLCRSWESPTSNPLALIPTQAGMPSILWDMHNNVPCASTISCSVPKQESLLLKDGLEISSSLCDRNCMDIARLEIYMGNLLIHIGKKSQIFCTLSKRVSQALNLKKYSDDCSLPGDNYPYWLTFKGEGASIKFKVPPCNDRDHLKGMTICFVHIPSGDFDDKACESCIICLMIINYTKNTNLVYTEDQLNSLEEAENNEILSNLESNDIVEVKAIIGNGLVVKKTAVYLIYIESFDKHMEPSTSEAKNLSDSRQKCEEEEE